MLKELKENSKIKIITIKMLAMFLVMLLTFMNIAFVNKIFGKGATLYATQDIVSNQDANTSEDNVKFEVYLDANDRNKKTAVADINSKDLILYVQVKVQNGGVLREGTISFGDTNFVLQQEGGNELVLDTIPSGNVATAEFAIKAKKGEDIINAGLLDMVSQIRLTGKYTNNDGNVVEITGEKYVQIAWSAANVGEENNPVLLEQEIITNKVLNLNGEDKRIIQIAVNSGVIDNIYPIKGGTITANTPVLLGGVEPEDVYVSTYGTTGTNGRTDMVRMPSQEDYPEGVEPPENTLEANTYTYIKSEKKINISLLENKPDSNNNIFWNKSKTDEIIITYIYPSETDVSYIQSEMANLVILYTSDNVTLEGTSTLIEDATEEGSEVRECSNITALDVVMTDKVYKSKLNIGESIVYEGLLSIGISYADLLDSIVIVASKDTIYNEEETKSYFNTFYDTLYLNRDEFLSIFGDEGYINIYDNTTQELIYQINKDIEADENGNIVFEYPKEFETEKQVVGEYYLITSKPLSEGKLNIYNSKVIVSDELLKEDIFDMFKLENVITLAGTQEEDMIEVRQSGALMEMESPVTLSKLEMDRNTFSTTQANDVIFTITLKTDDLQYDLYVNPVFEIEFPSYIKGTDINDVQILSGNGLEIARVTGYTNAINGNSIIRIELTGEQTEYGTNAQIIIDAVLTTEKFIPSVDSEIVLRFENGKETTYLEEYNKIDIASISIQAEPGILLVSAARDYKEDSPEVSAFREETKKGVLEMNAEEKLATFKGMIINNTVAKEYDVTILGRIPFVGNKDIESGIDLGTTIETELKSQILLIDSYGNPVSATIYYSENGDATDDLADPENGWTDQATTATKSYLIVIDCINEKEVIEFIYNAMIPAGLGVNEELYTTYVVTAGGNTIVSPLLGLETDKEVELDVEISCSTEEDKKIFQDQNVTYTVNVKNSGEIAVKNIKIENILSHGVSPVDGMETEWIIDSLEPGEEVEKEITVYIGEGTGGSVTYGVVVTADYLQESILKTMTHEVEEIGLKVTLEKYIWGDISIIDYQEVPLQVGTQIFYNIYIENTSSETINDVSITNFLPEQLSYVQVRLAKYAGWNIPETGDKVYTFINTADVNIDNELGIVNIEKIEPGEEYMVRVTAKVVKYAEYVKNVAIVKCDEVLGEGNEIILEDITGMITPTILNCLFTSETDGEVIRPGETIEYVLYIKNDGQTGGMIDVSNILPEGVRAISGKYRTNDEEYSNAVIGAGELTISKITLQEGDILEIRILVEALELSEGVKSKTIFNSMSITGEYIESIQTKEILNVIRAAADDPTAYEVSGIAWLDANADGKRDETEAPLSGITVKLMNTETKEYVADENGRTISVKTDKDGKYTLLDVELGKYFVVFEFDNNAYKVTTYHASGAAEAFSSDAITVTEDGEVITRTDEINVYNRDINNINIGLVSKPIFDLKIDKYISKITVQNQDGTEVTKYDKETGKLAKIDVRAKYLVDTVVVIEYTIEVSNVGEIAGIVKTIIDYSGGELQFNSELNPSWYEGSNGKLYSKALENEKIETGKSKQIKLVLTKTMTSSNTGLTNNTAEIDEYYNDAAIVSLNKGNEISSADVIITIRTGSPVMYISIIVMCMAILSVGVYIINKKVLASGRRDV